MASSALRELNDSKAQGIMAYLDSVERAADSDPFALHARTSHGSALHPLPSLNASTVCAESGFGSALPFAPAAHLDPAALDRGLRRSGSLPAMDSKAGGVVPHDREVLGAVDVNSPASPKRGPLTPSNANTAGRSVTPCDAGAAVGKPSVSPVPGCADLDIPSPMHAPRGAYPAGLVPSCAGTERLNDSETHQGFRPATSHSAYSAAMVPSHMTVGAPQTGPSIRRKIEDLKASNSSLAADNARLREDAAAREAAAQARCDAAIKDARAEAARARDAATVQAAEHGACLKQLLTDKGRLTAAVEELSAKLATQEARSRAESRKLEELHAAALAEAKGKLAAQEKARREQWAVKEAKRIKEQTLKAMEPDIALLLNRHKAEKRRLEEDHKDALRRKEDHLRDQERQQTATKLGLGREFEEMLRKERDAARRTTDEEVRRAEQRCEEQRRAVEHQAAEQQREAQHAVDALRSRVAELEAAHAAACRDAARAAEQRTHEASCDRDSLEAAHAAAMQRREREILAAEQDRIDAAVAAARAEDDGQRREFERRCVRQRDEAVAKVIARLEEEQVADARRHKEELERREATAVTAQREADRYKAELEAAAARTRDSRALLQERDAALQEAQRDVARLRQRVQEQQSTTDTEFEDRLRALDSAWRAKVTALENEQIALLEAKDSDLLKLRRSIDRVRDEARADAEAADRKHALELAALNERILVTVTKKDQQLRQCAERVASLEAAVGERDEELQRHHRLLAE